MAEELSRVCGLCTSLPSKLSIDLNLLLLLVFESKRELLLSNALARPTDFSSLTRATEAERGVCAEVASDTSDDELRTAARVGRLDMERSLFDLSRKGAAKLELLPGVDVGDITLSGGLSTRKSSSWKGAGRV